MSMMRASGSKNAAGERMYFGGGSSFAALSALVIEFGFLSLNSSS
jgi:hypothetical protein